MPDANTGDTGLADAQQDAPAPDAQQDALADALVPDAPDDVLETDASQDVTMPEGGEDVTEMDVATDVVADVSEAGTSDVGVDARPDADGGSADGQAHADASDSGREAGEGGVLIVSDDDGGCSCYTPASGRKGSGVVVMVLFAAALMARRASTGRARSGKNRAST